MSTVVHTKESQPLLIDASVGLPSKTNPVINPDYEHLCQKCECLGQATVNGVTADLFICAETVIARFSDRPGDHVAAHISHLNAFSDVFLLAAFRLHLDAQGFKPEYVPAAHPVQPLKG